VILAQDPTSILASLFGDERPGPEALAGHVARTGYGQVWLDRPVDPQLVIVRCLDNVLVRGDPTATDGQFDALVTGWVDAPVEFEPLLRNASDRFVKWQRMVFVLDGEAAPVPSPRVPGTSRVEVRRVTGADVEVLATQPPEFRWVIKTWPTIADVAVPGYAWAAFVDGELASVASSFFAGARHEDLAVVTYQRFRRNGLSAAAAAGVCRDVRTRGLRPSWTTWRENEASQATAARLGFRHHHDRPVYLVGMDPPAD
jgi:RimJ/RimL family protein N-acetyltransferase